MFTGPLKGFCHYVCSENHDPALGQKFTDIPAAAAHIKHFGAVPTIQITIKVIEPQWIEFI
jgi:hypothetical protein